MARVELLTRETAPLLARPYFENGDPGPIAAALAQVPELLETAMPLLGTVYGPTSVDTRLKEIVILRTSAANGCRYCTESHTRVARRLGFDQEEVAALRRDGPVPERWTERERALVAFSDALSYDPAQATACLRSLFTDAEIVELVTVGSVTIMLNRFATSLELPV